MAGFDHVGGETLDIDGASIYFEMTGASNAPPLLLLHGGFGSIEDFAAIVPWLAMRFKVIGIDSRGHAKSTLGAAPLTFERLKLDVLAVLAHLNIAKIPVIGFSDGGIVAYRMASQAAGIVDKLVTVGAAFTLTDASAEISSKVTGKSWREKFPQSYELYQKHNPAPDFDKFAGAVTRMWLDRNASGYPGEGVREIDCPTLIARGDDDHLFSLKEAVELRSMVKGAKLLNLSSAGHVAFSDRTQAFLDCLAAFLIPDSRT